MPWSTRSPRQRRRQRQGRPTGPPTMAARLRPKSGPRSRTDQRSHAGAEHEEPRREGDQRIEHLVVVAVDHPRGDHDRQQNETDDDADDSNGARCLSSGRVRRRPGSSGDGRRDLTAGPAVPPHQGDVVLSAAAALRVRVAIVVPTLHVVMPPQQTLQGSRHACSLLAIKATGKYHPHVPLLASPLTRVAPCCDETRCREPSRGLP